MPDGESLPPPPMFQGGKVTFRSKREWRGSELELQALKIMPGSQEETQSQEQSVEWPQPTKGGTPRLG